MHLSRLPIVLALVLLGSCASTAMTTSDAAPAKANGGDAQEEIAGLEHELGVARTKLEIAELELEQFEAELEVDLRHAGAAAEMAQGKLTQFQELLQPNRLADARLDLTTARDRAQEAADELAQIEIMYQDQDLDDVTAEFVVQRGRRSAARAAARIEIQEAEFRSLETYVLPRELRELELAVDKARTSLEQAKAQGDIGRRGKELALREARHKLEELEVKLEKKRGDA